LKNAKKASIVKYLVKKKFKKKKNQKGANGAPGAISIRVHGDDSKHALVRKEIIDFINKNPKFKGERFEKAIRGPFSEDEFKAAAYLYDIPIVLIYYGNKTTFFD
jgi:hypothetical protein